MREAHCTGCHQHFSGLSAFDVHQRMDTGGRATCRDPATLVSQDGVSRLLRRPDGVWAYPPMGEAAKAALRRMDTASELEEEAA